MPLAETARRVPIREGLFTVPEDPSEPPRLYGVECPRCGARFAGKRVICLECAHNGLRDCLLSPHGELWTFTIVHQKPPGSVMEPPYVIAHVRLSDGTFVQGVLTGVAPGQVRVGLAVETALMQVRRDESGADVLAIAFRPREEAAT